MAKSKPKSKTPDARTVECEFVLDDGTQVVLYRGTGHDVVRAQMLMTPQLQSSPMGVYLARAVVQCTFDGERRTLEDLLDMDADDVQFVATVMMAGKSRSRIAAAKGSARDVIAQLMGDEDTSPTSTSPSSSPKDT